MDNLSVSILYADEYMIDIEIRLERHDIFMTFMYRRHVVRHRDLVWKRLSRMSTTRSKAWFMIGDFSEITENHKKRGGRRRLESSFFPFRIMLENCGMLDFPYKGNSFLWMEKHNPKK